jgi:hypothetical protein
LKLNLRRRLVFGLLALSVFSLKLEAQTVTFDGCRDINGYAVASVSNPSIQDIAIAAIFRGNPVIYYNPYVLANTRAQTRLFFYAHECGHHALGHTLKGLQLGQEQEADCWGINTLVEQRLVSDNDISLIQADIARFARGDWTHLPGPQRAINLRGCLGSSSHNSSGSTERVPSMPRGKLAFRESIIFLLKASENDFTSIKRNVIRHSDGAEEWKPSIIVAGSRGCDGQSDRDISPSISCDMAQAQSAEALEEQYQALLTELKSCLDKTFVFSEKHGGKSTKLTTPIKEATFERKGKELAPDGPAVRIELSQYHGSRRSEYELTVWIDGKERE